MTERYVLGDAIAGVDALIAALRDRGYRVVGPRLRNSAIVLDDVDGVRDLPAGWGDVQDAATYRVRRGGDRSLFGYAVGPQSPRRYLSPLRHTMWSAVRTESGFDLIDEQRDVPPIAFLGIRACDLAAVGIQDRVLRDGPHPDPAYVEARGRAFFVGVGCTNPAATCFCASTGSSPGIDVGHDLAVTELLEGERHELFVAVGTTRGAAVIEDVRTTVVSREATADDVAAVARITATAAAGMRRHLDPQAARDVLSRNLDHPRWAQVADRCLSCTNCTMVCPTCFCTAMEDVTSLDGDRTERVQRWDSCFSLGHSMLHGAGSVRDDIRSRYRQWLTHKLSTWWDQFGTSGCVGCGRCIAWCPAGIDLTDEVAAMLLDVGGSDGS